LQLPGVELAGPDAADALAIAICHAHHLQSASARVKVVVPAARKEVVPTARKAVVPAARKEKIA
jgi:crossover junction endodeoxyribonuclease RuvC